MAPLRTPSGPVAGFLPQRGELAGGNGRRLPGLAPAPAGEHRARAGHRGLVRAPRHARALRARGRRRPSRASRRRPFRAAPRPRSARRARPSRAPASTRITSFRSASTAPPTRKMSPWSAAMRRAAISTALTLAALLAHEGARRARHLVDDGDVAGDEVGELRQEKRRAEVVGEPLVDELLRPTEPCRRLRGWSGRPSGRVRRPRPRPPCWYWRGCRCCR